MRETADGSSRHNHIRNHAIAERFAGFGSTYAETNIRVADDRESMRDTTATKFDDVIYIYGEPESYLPIGLALFPYLVTRRFRQPDVGYSVHGDANLEASFFAQGMNPDFTFRHWPFPTLNGPQHQHAEHLLTTKVKFVVMQPILIHATLDGASKERTIFSSSASLAATLDSKGELQPIRVFGLKNTRVVMSHSGTKYYTEDEAGATDVKLLTVDTRLHRRQ